MRRLSRDSHTVTELDARRTANALVLAAQTLSDADKAARRARESEQQGNATPRMRRYWLQLPPTNTQKWQPTLRTRSEIATMYDHGLGQKSQNHQPPHKKPFIDLYTRITEVKHTLHADMASRERLEPFRKRPRPSH